MCDDEFGREEGSVVCRMLGLPGGVKIHNQAAFGEGEVRVDISRYYLHCDHIYSAGPGWIYLDIIYTVTITTVQGQDNILSTHSYYVGPHLDQDYRVLG